jgi:hypothetical protein
LSGIALNPLPFQNSNHAHNGYEALEFLERWIFFLAGTRHLVKAPVPPQSKTAKKKGEFETNISDG